MVAAVQRRDPAADVRDLLCLLEKRAVLVQRFLRAHRLADVAKARDAADDAAADTMRRDVALEDAAVPEMEHVQMLRRRVGRQQLRRRPHGMRIVELRGQPAHDQIEAAGGDLVRLKAERFEAAAVAPDYVSGQIHHENRVVRGVERRFEQSNGFFRRRAIGH